MKAALLSITLSCLCAICAADDIPVQQNLDINKLAGKWYPIVTAKHEAMQRPIYAYTIEPEQDGDVLLKVEIPRFANCKVKKIPLKAVTPGIYSLEDGMSTVHVVDTDYDTYLISHYMTGGIVFLNLYGRQKDVQDKVKQRFMTFVEKLNFNPERLFYRHEMDMCTDPPAGS